MIKYKSILKCLIMIWALGVSFLFFALEVASKAPIYMPSLALNLEKWDEGYIEAQGTFVGSDESITSKTQTSVSNIVCDKARGTCRASFAYIYPMLMGSTGERADSIKGIAVGHYEAPIFKWTSEFIIYKAEFQCSERTYTVNKLTEQIDVVANRKNTDGCEDEPEKFKQSLVNGREINRKQVEEVNNNFVIMMILWGAVFVLFALLFRRNKAS